MCKRKIKSVEGLRRYRTYKHMNILSPCKKFYIFSKDSDFFNVQEKSKLTLRCTAPIYVLSICKKKIKSVEGLRRYRPYKLMNILSPYKKVYIFSKNSHFFNFREKSKLTLRSTSPIYVLFICKRKTKSIERLRRYRPYKLMNIASPYKKFYIFSKNSHFFNFWEKSKLTLRSTAQIIYVLSICRRKIKSVEGLRRYRPYKLMNIASPYKEFYIFSKNCHFLNFREKSKLTLRCTVPIYVLSICKRKIKSVEGLRRYRPYKLVLTSVDTRTARRTGRTEYYSSPLRRWRGTNN